MYIPLPERYIKLRPNTEPILDWDGNPIPNFYNFDHNPIIHDGETYTFIKEELESEGQMEYWMIIVQRESDKKYFKYFWSYDTGNDDYEYEPEWEEVKKKSVTIDVFETKD